MICSSVHNIRIERLWFDFAKAVANKWKDFFYDLELYYNLSPDNDAHIWLLHHLFLKHINQDATKWQEAWNSHKIAMDGQRRRSPRDMFVFGLLEQGSRGLGDLIRQQEEEIEDFATFGVDWEAQDIPAIIRHHQGNNPQDWEHENPFATFTAPATTNDVVVEPPNAPLTEEQIAELDTRLALVADVESRQMSARKLVWKEALAICSDFFCMISKTSYLSGSIKRSIRYITRNIISNLLRNYTVQTHVEYV